MSNLILDHPSTTHLIAAPSLPGRDLAAAPGSYVDSDGVRRTPRRVGSYVTTSSSAAAVLPAVGSYTDRDGVRRPTRQGSYTRVER